jgi:hypothetical protein
MGRWWLTGALILVPGLAQAGTDAPIDLALDGAQPVRTAPPTPNYAAQPPAAHGYIPDGWAMRATFRGRAMDLQSRDWSDDPHAQPHDIEAGYGWRDGRTTALIGYEQHDFGPRPTQTARALERDPNQPPPVSGGGVLGFSLVLHGR